MMAKNNNCSGIVSSQTKPERMPLKFIEDMSYAMDIRVANKLIKSFEVSLVKALELFMKTDGYKISLEELKTKPEKGRNYE